MEGGWSFLVMAYKTIMPVGGLEEALSSMSGGSLLLRRAIVGGAPETAPTPGLLYYRPDDGEPWELVCHTMERPAISVGGVGPRIPAGTYPLSLQSSNSQASSNQGRWKAQWASNDPRRPLLWGVPGRSAIQIHAGGKVDDSRGCILVGHYAHYLDKMDWLDSMNTFKKVRGLWAGPDPNTYPQRIIIQEVEV